MIVKMADVMLEGRAGCVKGVSWSLSYVILSKWNIGKGVAFGVATLMNLPTSQPPSWASMCFMLPIEAKRNGQMKIHVIR